MLSKNGILGVIGIVIAVLTIWHLITSIKRNQLELEKLNKGLKL